MSESLFNKRLRRRHAERFGLLRDWYGSDFAETEVSAHISMPFRLDRGVRTVLAGIETPEAQCLRRLRECWPEIAGGGFAKMAVPADWRAGVLFLEVRHSALLRELQPSLELICGAVRRFSGEVECREVRLIIAGGGRKYPK